LVTLPLVAVVIEENLAEMPYFVHLNTIRMFN